MCVRFYSRFLRFFLKNDFTFSHFLHLFTALLFSAYLSVGVPFVLASSTPWYGYTISGSSITVKDVIIGGAIVAGAALAAAPLVAAATVAADGTATTFAYLGSGAVGAAVDTAAQWAPVILGAADVVSVAKLGYDAFKNFQTPQNSDLYTKMKAYGDQVGLFTDPADNTYKQATSSASYALPNGVSQPASLSGLSSRYNFQGYYPSSAAALSAAKSWTPPVTPCQTNYNGIQNYAYSPTTVNDWGSSFHNYVATDLNTEGWGAVTAEDGWGHCNTAQAKGLFIYPLTRSANTVIVVNNHAPVSTDSAFQTLPTDVTDTGAKGIAARDLENYLLKALSPVVEQLAKTGTMLQTISATLTDPANMTATASNPVTKTQAQQVLDFVTRNIPASTLSTVTNNYTSSSLVTNANTTKIAPQYDYTEQIHNGVAEALNDNNTAIAESNPVVPDKKSLTDIINTYVSSLSSLPVVNILQGVHIDCSGASSVFSIPSLSGGSVRYDFAPYTSGIDFIGNILYFLSCLECVFYLFRSN